MNTIRTTQNDDVQGHGFIQNVNEMADSDDVQGRGLVPNVNETVDSHDDVEGHGFSQNVNDARNRHFWVLSAGLFA